MKRGNTDMGERLEEIATGYRAAQVVLAANRLGLFQALCRETSDLDTLADKLSCNVRALRILCDALVSLGLLQKESAKYRTHADVIEFFTPGKPTSKAAMLSHHAVLYQRWARLFDSVKTGCPAPADGPCMGLSSSKEDFAQAMADSGRASAERTVAFLDLGSASRVLDVGGGPGIYAIAMCSANPKLQVTVLDDDETLVVARKNVADAGLADRISFVAGDFFSVSMPNEFDYIFVSNVIHMFSSQDNGRLISRAASHLVPGGKICIKDFFISEDRTEPVWSALFSVNMLVNTVGGQCYSREEVEGWFAAAGLRVISFADITDQSSVLVAMK